MLPRKTSLYTRVISFLPLLLWALPLFAEDTGTSSGSSSGSASPVSITALSAQTMLQNIAEQVPYLTQMVTAIAYVMGMYFIIQGVIKLKHVGESRTMMSQEHGYMGPITLIVIGALLIYLPTSVQVGMSTFWTDPNPYGYEEEQSDQWTYFINDCYIIVQLVGTIAFIRGLVMLTQLGEGRAQPGLVGRAMTHIIGGILCINVYQFIQMVLVTLGIQT